MSSEQSTALHSWATERGEKENTTNKMRISGVLEKKNWCVIKRDSVSVPKMCKQLKAPLSTAITVMGWPQLSIHKILAGIQPAIRESMQAQKGKLVLLLKSLKEPKTDKE